MTFYEMEPATVQHSGHAVCGLTDSATGLARQFLSSLDTTRATVHHPTVQNALERYREQWHQPVYQVALEIDNLGTVTNGSAVVVADTDETGHTLLANETSLCRPINTEPIQV
jgi:hypothetical protein